MNGAFDRNNTYPYDYQRFGDLYRVVYVPTMQELTGGLHVGEAAAISLALRQEMPEPADRESRARYYLSLIRETKNI